MGSALHDATEQRPVRRITLFGFAAYDKNSPARDLPQRFDRQSQSLRRIGPIDEHAERLSTFQSLHATGHAIDGFNSTNDRFEIQTRDEADSRGGQAIRNVL